MTTSGELESWKLLFWVVTLLSLGVGITSLVAVLSTRDRVKTERSDVIELMDEIQSLYISDGSEPQKITEETATLDTRVYDEDVLYEQAKGIAYSEGKVSSSLLQRRMRIGYARAARIVERMEEEGIVGQPDGARPRPLLKDINIGE